MPPASKWAALVKSPLSIYSVKQTSCITRSFSSSQIQRKAGSKKKASNDAYAKTQRLRHAAALASRERWKAATDPKEAVSGKPTTFLESFDIPTPLTESETTFPQRPLNFGLGLNQVQSQLTVSKFLLSPTRPLPVSQKSKSKIISLDGGEQNAETSSETGFSDVEADPRHTRAAEAMKRITSLELGSSGDRLSWNIKRCVEKFGRHNTDSELPIGTGRGPKSTPRVGKDTGSSEVQIAVLTAKIRALSTNLKNKDKANKRNLRTLVHKRQKLLSYLQRRERGGPRWQNLIQTLGLTEATWKGQICI